MTLATTLRVLTYGWLTKDLYAQTVFFNNVLSHEYVSNKYSTPKLESCVQFVIIESHNKIQWNLSSRI
jgi:hypothetical protein